MCALKFKKALVKNITDVLFAVYLCMSNKFGAECCAPQRRSGSLKRWQAVLDAVLAFQHKLLTSRVDRFVDDTYHFAEMISLARLSRLTGSGLPENNFINAHILILSQPGYRRKLLRPEVLQEYIPAEIARYSLVFLTNL